MSVNCGDAPARGSLTARPHSITFDAPAATLASNRASANGMLSQEIQHGRISEADRVTLATSDVTHDEQC